MNAYTTTEESKQLIEAGLDVGTADMCYIQTPIDEYRPVAYSLEYCNQLKQQRGSGMNLIPCWSLAALLDIIDDNDIPYRLRNSPNSESGYILSVKVIYQEGMNKSVDIIDFDKVIGCITYLLENNYIKSNKNE